MITGNCDYRELGLQGTVITGNCDYRGTVIKGEL